MVSTGKKAQEEKENQMAALRSCKSDTVREMIFGDLDKIGADIIDLEKQVEIERARHHVVTEKQIVDFFNKLAKGNVKDMSYRKTLIKVMVNRIYLYDDRMTITFNSGDEEVTITDKLLSDIETDLRNKRLCILNQGVHHEERLEINDFWSFFFFVF